MILKQYTISALNAITRALNAENLVKYRLPCVISIMFIYRSEFYVRLEISRVRNYLLRV